MELSAYLVVAVVAYLLGSLPTGFVLGKTKGIDIRARGSGNIGATNAFRALGTLAGLLVLVVDGLKGYAACAWLVDVALRHSAADELALRIIAGLGAVLGHNYTCWLRFRGGKGVATSAGVLAALVPGALLVIGGIWLLVFVWSRYVSLASICACFTLPIATWITRGSLTLILVTAGMALLAIYKHRANIRRLLQGTEHRIGSHGKEARA